MAVAPYSERGSKRPNPAKSWKMMLLLIPMLIVGVWVAIWSQQRASARAKPARPVSAADGKVRVVAPQAEVDSVLWDGEVTWYPYPNAASYEIQIYHDPGNILWKQTTDSPHLLTRTEAFPYDLRYYLNHSNSVGYNIIARDQKGNVIANSGPVYFYLKMNPQMASQ